VLRKDLQLAKDLHNRSFYLLYTEESLDTTPLDAGVLFELCHTSNGKYYTVWVIISYDALKDIHATKSSSVIALLRLLLYDVRKTKDPGRYKVVVE
jgi:hypothetical protein